MTARSRGPLFADHYRLLKAAKKVGAKAVRVEIDGTAVTILLDDALASAELAAAPPPEEPRKPKLVW